MPLTDDQKRANRVARKLEEFQCKLPQRCLGITARKFQEMIRAEAGAREQHEPAIVKGKFVYVPSPLGCCVCVTCGDLYPWKNTGQTHSRLDAGHFLGGRYRSIVLEETNCHPQCVRDNTYGKDDSIYEKFMRAVYGQGEIDRLRLLKNTAETIDKEDLAERFIVYSDRVNAAVRKMK